jgi:hypothetical protein
MNQPKQMSRIWELEWMLHRIKGQSGKHLERKVLLAEIEQLSKEFKSKKR